MHKIIPTLTTLAWLVIEAMVLLNPSGTIAGRMAEQTTLWFFLVSPLVVFLCAHSTAQATRTPPFFRRLGASLVLLVLLSWGAGAAVHRDFFTFPAQLVMLYAALFLARLDGLGIVRRKVEVYRALSFSALLMFLLWILWLMLMSYAIVVRTEPRWIEATAYNLVNGLIGVLLAYSGATLRDQARQVIRLESDRVYLDQRDISAILSPQEGRLLQLFLGTSSHSFTCRSLLQNLKEEDEDGMERTDCPACLSQGWSASQCGAYRNFKNRISDTKKYLELLQIGTIVPVSENPRQIKELGWRLRLFDDVRYDKYRK